MKLKRIKRKIYRKKKRKKKYEHTILLVKREVVDCFVGFPLY